jgi:glycosyltransferase involved in cell wall biosynthesis
MYRLEDTYAWDVLEGNDGFKRVTLFESNKTQIPDTANVVRRVWRSLSECKPTEVVVPGWFGVEALAALQWCLQSGTPAVVMSESTRWDERRQVWKEWVKGRIVRLCSAALVGGAPQAEYLAALGMPRDRIAIGYDAVDNEHFAEGAADSRRQTSEFRIQHRLPEKYFLASMRFVEKKNAPRLLQAYALYRKKSEARSRGSEVGSPMSDLGPRTSDLRPPTSDLWNLVLLGDGPLKSDVCRLISDLGLQDHVMLPGFKQYGELPTYYGLASAFVHASTTEQWGLVVNEAMASNLPVLVSRRCGCASDLVHEGRNGFTFDPFDVDSLAELMVRISSLPPQEMIAMGQASSRIIADWGPERFANGLCEAVEVASSAPAPRASQFDRLLLKALLERGSR